MRRGGPCGGSTVQGQKDEPEVEQSPAHLPTGPLAHYATAYCSVTSLPAGRLMSRTQAFDTLDYKEYQARLSENGVFSTTANSSTLDEAPMAYKAKDTIMGAIKETVDVVSMLKPFYNFKASEGGRR